MFSTSAISGQSRNVGTRERWFSALGGAGLVLNGMRRPTMTNALLGLAGVGLLYRAATGHCPLYQQLGINTAYDGASDTPRLMQGKTYGYGKRGRTSLKDEVEKASEDSFPASDPPAWTPTSSLGSPVAVD